MNCLVKIGLNEKSRNGYIISWFGCQPSGILPEIHGLDGTVRGKNVLDFLLLPHRRDCIMGGRQVFANRIVDALQRDSLNPFVKPFDV